MNAPSFPATRRHAAPSTSRRALRGGLRAADGGDPHPGVQSPHIPGLPCAPAGHRALVPAPLHSHAHRTSKCRDNKPSEYCCCSPADTVSPMPGSCSLGTKPEEIGLKQGGTTWPSLI